MDPYAVGSSGMHVLHVAFNPVSSAWEIDVAVSKSSDEAVLALYLPRASTAADGFYTAQFNSTFLPASFPCSTADTTSKAATTCCLADFVALYHVVSAFTFQASPQCVSPYSSPPLLNHSSEVTGTFGPDMPATGAVLLPPTAGQDERVSVVRISVGATDLRSAASRFSGQAGVSETIESFVGLAQFVPVPGSRIIDSSAMQVRLSIFKSDYFTVASSATVAQTFLRYINIRANEVIDASDPTASARSQYAAVSFALSDAFSPNANTGVIPAASIRVGLGATFAAVSWTTPCQRSLSSDFTARLSQACGPSVEMCAPAASLADRFDPPLPNSHISPS
jgi:hypothetical protein